MTPDDRPKYGAYDKTRFDRESIKIAVAHGMTPPNPPRRDVFGIVLAVVLLVFGAGTSVLALQGGWWLLLWVIAGPFILFGVVGLTLSLPKVPRDAKGYPLR